MAAAAPRLHMPPSKKMRSRVPPVHKLAKHVEREQSMQMAERIDSVANLREVTMANGWGSIFLIPVCGILLVGWFLYPWVISWSTLIALSLYHPLLMVVSAPNSLAIIPIAAIAWQQLVLADGSGVPWGWRAVIAVTAGVLLHFFLGAAHALVVVRWGKVGPEFRRYEALATMGRETHKGSSRAQRPLRRLGAGRWAR